MRLQGHNVILLIDNFVDHYISYQSRNVRLKFFALNMTPFIQPLNADIIRMFKALYKHDFYLRAVDLNEVDQFDIYKISLLEVIIMIKAAWDCGRASRRNL